MMRRVGGLQSFGEMLRGQKSKVLGYWRNVCLLVKVIRRRSYMGPRYKMQGFVLHKLQLADRSIRIVRENNGRRVIEKWSDEPLEGRCQAFLIVAKFGICHCAQDIETATCFPRRGFRVSTEREEWVEGDAKQLGVVVLRDSLVPHLHFPYC